MPTDNPRKPIEQNAGRCDICGKPIDMSSGDRMEMSEFGVMDDRAKEEHGLDDEQAINAVADALEGLAETPEGHNLADVIREEGEMKTHQRCLDETNYDALQVGI